MLRLPASYLLTPILYLAAFSMKSLGQMVIWRTVPSSSDCVSAMAQLRVVRDRHSSSFWGAHRTEKAKSSSLAFATASQRFLTLDSSSFPSRK